MKSNCRGFGSAIVLLIIGILAVVGCAYYMSEKPTQTSLGSNTASTSPGKAASSPASKILTIPQDWTKVHESTKDGIYIVTYVSPNGTLSNSDASISMTISDTKDPDRAKSLVKDDGDSYARASLDFKSSTRVVSGVTVYDEGMAAGRSYTRYTSFVKDGKFYRIRGTYKYETGSAYADTITVALDSIRIP